MKPDLLQNLSARALAGIRRAIRNHKFEFTPTGIFLPSEKAVLAGTFTHDVNGLDMQVDHNLVTTEGRNHILDAVLHGSAQIPTWYVALFAGNVTPAATWTGANFAANSTEFTNYTESTRQEYVEGAAASGVTNNYASKAAFTIGVGGGTVYGGAILSSNVKAGVTGICLASSRFTNSRLTEEADVLNIGYQLSLTSS